MDKNFTFRFFEVERERARIPPMIDILRSIDGIQDLTGREKQLASDYTIRLEKLDDDGTDAVVGELLRCQNTNMPAEISDGERKTLNVDRLGHSVVFRYNHRQGILGIQHDNRVVSLGKFLVYLASFNQSAIYSAAPIVNQKAWEKFNSGLSRKLQIKIASPIDLADIGGAGSAVSNSFRSMAEAYEAPYITVELSMGTRKGSLSESVKGLAKSLFGSGLGGAHIEKMKAKTVVNDASEDVDLIQERVVAKEKLQVHDRDPEVNWKIKKSYLCEEMRRLFG